MLESASLISENMDQSLVLVPKLTSWRRTARSSKQLGGATLFRGHRYAVLAFRVQNAYVMYTVCARFAIFSVQPVNPNLRFMCKIEYK